jgi:hypothetical protein
LINPVAFIAAPTAMGAELRVVYTPKSFPVAPLVFPTIFVS